jgi:hypothetical protein
MAFHTTRVTSVGLTLARELPVCSYEATCSYTALTEAMGGWTLLGPTVEWASGVPAT